MTALLSLPLKWPCLFFCSATIWSIFLGIRGVALLRRNASSQPLSSSSDIIESVQNFSFNAIAAMAGFAAWFVECKIFLAVKNLSEISGGTAAVLVFLPLVALLGIGGSLPHVLHHGKSVSPG